MRGASVYTLSEDGERPRGRGAGGAREPGDTTVAPSSTVARTLVAMAQRGTVNDSRRLAETIVGTFGQAGIRLLPRTHRQAGFAVLTSPDIPAALVELGYLSNPRDEKLLTVRQHQIALARALRASVDAHFGERENQKGLIVSAAARDAPRSAAPPPRSPACRSGMCRNSFGPCALECGPSTPVMRNCASGNFSPSMPMNGIVPPSPM